ncbi:Mitotic check point protein BFA1 [Spathaspora sp. JA1]|nr:Mitotic check point protein BFA1 [Spathaspora sp. JA1]
MKSRRSTISPSNQQHLRKSELLTRFADTDNDDEIFGDIEGIDFGHQLPQLNSSRSKTERINRHDERVDTIKLEQLVIEDSPVNKTTPSPSYNIGDKGDSKPRSKNSPSSSGGDGGSGEIAGRRRVMRECLSEYSEDMDTDVTSEFTDNDFQGLDDIFQGDNTMKQRLNAQKILHEKQAEREQDELRMMYTIKRDKISDFDNDPNQTLKLKDFSMYQQENNKLTNENLNLLDMIESENTVNYEYTRDDFGKFEEGFDVNFEKNIHRQAKQIKPPIRTKHSMPVLRGNSMNSVKKFKSTMDFGTLKDIKEGEDTDDEEEAELPEFNFNNNVIRKLDRIPSFYNNNSSAAKTQLLNKYKEQSDKHKHKIKHHSSKSKLGTVKYLNNNSIISDPLYPTPKKTMKFNPTLNRWEGNEIDLMRFESVTKPTLITYQELQSPKKVNRPPNMVYDQENLRWVNMNHDDESVFHDIPDLIEMKPYKLNSPPGLKPSIQERQSPQRISPINRGTSQFTQRTISSATTISKTKVEPEEQVQEQWRQEFHLSDKLIEKFQKEDIKIEKKVKRWFTNSDFGEDEFNRDYYWEIRKMVMENE